MCAWFKLYPVPEQLNDRPFKQVLNKIEKRLNSEKPSPVPIKNSEFFVPDYKPPDKTEYIETLKSQIQQKHKKTSEEMSQRYGQWISSDYSPYPNRVKTPITLKREREKLKMSEFRKALDTQLLEKTTQVHQKRQNDQFKSQNIIKADLEQYHKFEQKKKDKEDSEKYILTNSWAQATNKSIKMSPNPSISASLSPNNNNSKSFYPISSVLDNKKQALDKKIEAILEIARQSRQVSTHDMKFKSTNQIIKGGRKHFLVNS